MNFADIQLFEKLGFEAVPATQTLHDGSWMIRSSPDYPVKRANSINPVDPDDYPGDFKMIADRLARVEQYYVQHGNRVFLRQTPLCPPALLACLKKECWHCFDESIVMATALEDNILESGFPELKPVDIESFVDVYSKLSSDHASENDGFLKMLRSVRLKQEFFVLWENIQPVSAGRCVLNGQYSGIFDVVTGKAVRGSGFARQLTGGMLRWAISQSCSRAWLQVVAENEPAIRLYRKFGFEEAYRYCYWSPETAPKGSNEK